MEQIFWRRYAHAYVATRQQRHPFERVGFKNKPLIVRGTDKICRRIRTGIPEERPALSENGKGNKKPDEENRDLSHKFLV
jgi:hypothetical protein